MTLGSWICRKLGMLSAQTTWRRIISQIPIRPKMIEAPQIKAIHRLTLPGLLNT